MDQTVTVALPIPRAGILDYRWSEPSPPPAVGCRVRVPLQGREQVGIVIATRESDTVEPLALRPITARLDDRPLIPPELLALLRWAAGYYHHPLGAVLQTALPPRLREGAPLPFEALRRPRLTEAGQALLARLPARQRARRALLEAASRGEPLGRNAAVAMAEREGWIRWVVEPPPLAPGPAPTLTEEQAAVLTALEGRRGPTLLQGVTGSGKTEVYLALAAEALGRGEQVLLLVPEIGLTPQLTDRFRARFGGGVETLHSGLSDGERARVWLAAREGVARIVIGTRSAVWLPFSRLGLIVVDEEHDTSFKQQEGFRYSARDVAVYRAARLDCPVLLGSATPSLESQQRAAEGRYARLRLTRPVHSHRPPRIECVDLRTYALHEGLSPPLLKALDTCLEGDGQALIFLNRRGYAPVLLCHHCGFSAPCPHCDARFTLHRAPPRLICHHCGHQAAVPEACPSCGAPGLVPVGLGTERIEAALAARYPGIRLERIDTDRLRHPQRLAEALEAIRKGDVRLMVGTQMLAKGHDFPRLDLVGVVDADQALYSSDFRATERLGQLLTQVAGRAGRTGRPARVLVQTHAPDHPVLKLLLSAGYEALSQQLLAERRLTGLPPFGHLALLRAEAAEPGPALAFLRAAARAWPATPGVTPLPPVPAPMERRAGRARAQLLLMAEARPPLHQGLHGWVPGLDRLARAHRVRWSLDIDPVDLF